MFPEPGDAINRTIEAEAALTDLFSEAINEWVAKTSSFVVPNLAGVMVNGDPNLVAASVPPDPNGVNENQEVWDQLSEELILAGLSVIYALSLFEASNSLDIGVPSARRNRASQPGPSDRVYASLERTLHVSREQIAAAIAVVDDNAHLTGQRAAVINDRRVDVAATPALVRSKVEQAVAAVPTTNVEPSAVIVEQRAAALAVMTPGSADTRDVARYQGYQAAGVQNAAVLDAARFSEDADELDKVWLATIDGRTRPTHFAADGQRTPLDGSFTVGGVGLDRPGDPAGPASEVRNCRCRVGVLAHDEELPSDVDRHTERLDGRDSTARNRVGSQSDEVNRRAGRGTVRARDDEDGIGRTAAGAPTEEHTMKKTPAQLAAEALARTTGLAVTAAADGEGDAGETFRTFTDQPIAFIGIETSDGRMLAKDMAFSVRTPPLPMMWMKQTGSGFGGHTEAFTVGVIESAKVDGDTMFGSGYFLNSTEADEAYEQASRKVSRPSVDLGAIKWMLTDENGKEISEEEWWDMPIDATVIQCITEAELIGTTLVATPAFGETYLEFNAETESRDLALVASAAEQFRPRVYSAAFFTDPKLTGPTLPTMGDDGRIYGHLACFGACHRSIQSKCVMAPRSKTDYAHFHTAPAVRLDDNTRIPVGRLTVGTGHAPDEVRGPTAKAHYDNTGTCYALVRVGEDEHGIWFSGVAHPQATAEQVEAGITAPLSGDWRDFGQGLELIAALAVNTPGFAARGRDDAQGRPLALVASLGPAPEHGEGGTEGLTADGIAEIVSRAVTHALVKRDTDSEVAGLMAVAAEKAGPPPPKPSARDTVGALLSRVR